MARSSLRGPRHLGLRARAPAGTRSWAWDSGILGEVEEDSRERLRFMNANRGDELPAVQAVGVKRVALSLHEVVPLRSLGCGAFSSDEDDALLFVHGCPQM